MLYEVITEPVDATHERAGMLVHPARCVLAGGGNQAPDMSEGQRTGPIAPKYSMPTPDPMSGTRPAP